MENRVVITGMGVFSCLGNGIEEVTDSLKKGKSGIVYSQERKSLGYRSPLTGKLPEVNIKDYLDRKSRLRFSEHGLYAYIAVMEALKMSDIDEEYMLNKEIGLIVGNDSSAKAIIDGVDTIREKKNTVLVGSGNVFQSMNSTISMNLAVNLGIKGISMTVSAACASSSHAIGIATMMIRSGMQERIICAGAQEVNVYSVGSFDGISAFSSKIDTPQEASRPFDKDRDGLVPSGGGAAIVVESLKSAKERGAHIIAEIKGYGISSGGEHLTIPSVEGPLTAMQRALNDAKIKASDLDYINAHATSTKVGDANEAKAISMLLGDSKSKCHVSSTKSMTGHELWMAGTSEVIYSLIMMNNSFVAPNINLIEKCEEASELIISNEKIDKNIDYFLSNSFGFGGTNSALVISKWKE